MIINSLNKQPISFHQVKTKKRKKVGVVTAYSKMYWYQIQYFDEFELHGMWIINNWKLDILQNSDTKSDHPKTPNKI